MARIGDAGCPLPPTIRGRARTPAAAGCEREVTRSRRAMPASSMFAWAIPTPWKARPTGAAGR